MPVGLRVNNFKNRSKLLSGFFILTLLCNGVVASTYLSALVDLIVFTKCQAKPMR